MLKKTTRALVIIFSLFYAHPLHAIVGLEKTAEIPAATSNDFLEPITCIEYSKHPEPLLACAYYKTVTIWKTTQKKGKEHKPFVTLKHDNPVTAIAWDPTNNNQIVTATEDYKYGKFYIWDIEKRKVISKKENAHTKSICNIKWIKKDTFASASKDSTIKTWRLGKDKCLCFQETLDKHSDKIISIDCVQDSSSNKFLASASRDKTIKIWDANKNIKLMTTLLDEKHITTDVAWSKRTPCTLGFCARPENGTDRLVHIYRQDSAKIENIYLNFAPYKLSWHTAPDGRYLLAISGKKDTIKIIEIWNLQDDTKLIGRFTTGIMATAKITTENETSYTREIDSLAFAWATLATPVIAVADENGNIGIYKVKEANNKTDNFVLIDNGPLKDNLNLLLED